MGMELFFICPRCSMNLKSPAALAAHMAHHKQERFIKKQKKEVQSAKPNLEDLSEEEIKDLARDLNIKIGRKKNETLIKEIVDICQDLTNLKE